MSIKVITVVANKRYEVVLKGGFKLVSHGQVWVCEEDFSVFMTSAFRVVDGDETMIWVAKSRESSEEIISVQQVSITEMMRNTTFSHEILRAVRDHTTSRANLVIDADAAKEVTVTSDAMSVAFEKAKLVQLMGITDRAVDAHDIETFYQVAAMYRETKEVIERFEELVH